MAKQVALFIIELAVSCAFFVALLYPILRLLGFHMGV